ncbi:MAG: glycoside hydrolase family 28 protein [Bacteroidales bacterium]
MNFEVLRPTFPDRYFNIKDYGAVNDGFFLNTEAINSSIKECSQSGGGVVIIPQGVWLTGPIRLQNDVELRVEEGAVVLFSSNFDDYPYVKTYYEGQRDFRAMPLLFGDSLTNIAITGKGVLDGSGDAWRPVKKMKTTERQWEELVASGGVVSEEGDVWWPNKYAYRVSKDPDKYRKIIADLPDRDAYKAFYRPPLVQLISCKKVLLEGPLFQNSPAWCIHPLMCEHLTVNDISVKNPWYAQNGDGIDVESCTYVSITNSQFDVGDDAICVKSGRNEEGRKRGIPTRYMEVDNCVVHHGHGGFVVGSEMSGGVSDIWVRNCTFLGTDVGLRFKSTRGRGGVVENIYIENIRMINIERDAIIFNLFYAGLGPTEMGENPIEHLMADAPPVSEETPEFRNITMKDISCQGAYRAMRVMGLPEMPVTGITLENSVFRSTRGVECLLTNGLRMKDVGITTDGYPTMRLVNVKDGKIESLRGNHEILFEIDGMETEYVEIISEQPDSIAERIMLGKDVDKEKITINLP